MKYSAFFLDRDGTIIEDVGYIKHPKDVVFYTETFSALLKLQKHFKLFIITNQSGISKGITTEKEVQIVNDYIVSTLLLNGIFITQVYTCPHSTEDACNCKKPKPYFITQAAQSFEIDVYKSYIIGDHPSDVECGFNAGITPIYVLTGHGQKHISELHFNCKVSDNIADASQHIISLLN